MNADVVVIGAGLIGSAIAYGLAGRNVRVLVLDGGDRDFRASSANFGLVWLHGKGMDMPAYYRLTRDSVEHWPDFSAELADVSGVDLQYERKGGLSICLGEAGFEKRRAELTRLHNQCGSDPDWEMLDRGAVSKLLPKVQLGPEVTGASFGRIDGHINPLRLLSALHVGVARKGGRVLGGMEARSLVMDAGRFTIHCGAEQFSAARIVIAAGLGAKPLAAQVGLDIPVRPQRGQILVTERLDPFLPLPIQGLRQTGEGTVMIGTTHEEAGFDSSATGEGAAAISAHALRWVPALSEVKIVRQWSGLRILTPDGFPIFAESKSHPGAFVTTCHSGVTLAATHATMLANAIANGRLPSSLDVFHLRRFDVPKAA